MRLIDADALSAKMYHDAFETDSDMQKWDSGCWIRYGMFEKNLKDTPTTEAEQKRGHWKLLNNGDATCSECGRTHKNVWDFDTWDNFCRHCGARMG